MISFDIGIRNMSYSFIDMGTKQLLNYGIMDIFDNAEKGRNDFSVITE